MIKAIRTQDDDLGDKVSNETATEPGGESLTRPEFGPEADINNILLKYNVEQQSRPISYGQTIDYTLDLQQAKTALVEVQRLNTTVPEELHNQFPTWREVLNGAENGTYQAALQQLAQIKHEAEQRAKEKEEAKPPLEPPK